MWVADEGFRLPNSAWLWGSLVSYLKYRPLAYKSTENAEVNADIHIHT